MRFDARERADFDKMTLQTFSAKSRQFLCIKGELSVISQEAPHTALLGCTNRMSDNVVPSANGILHDIQPATPWCLSPHIGRGLKEAETQSVYVNGLVETSGLPMSPLPRLSSDHTPVDEPESSPDTDIAAPSESQRQSNNDALPEPSLKRKCISRIAKAQPGSESEFTPLLPSSAIASDRSTDSSAQLRPKVTRKPLAGKRKAWATAKKDRQLSPKPFPKGVPKTDSRLAVRPTNRAQTKGDDDRFKYTEEKRKGFSAIFEITAKTALELSKSMGTTARFVCPPRDCSQPLAESAKLSDLWEHCANEQHLCKRAIPVLAEATVAVILYGTKMWVE